MKILTTMARKDGIMVNGPDKSKLKFAQLKVWAGFFILSVGILTHGCRRGALPEGTVASVNGEAVTVQEFALELREQLGVGREEAASFGDKNNGRYQEIKGKILDQVIEQHLLQQEARKKGVEVDPLVLQAEVDEARRGLSESDFARLLKDLGIDEAAWHERLENRLRIRLLQNQEVQQRVDVSSEDVRTYYEGHQSDFTMPAQVRVSQIVVATEGEAHNLAQNLKAHKAENFAELAKKFSQSPDAENGGDVGFYAKGQMPSVFDLAFDLPVGAVSPVTPSEYGFHIFKVVEKRGSRVQALSEVAPQILERLKQEQESKLYAAWMAKLKKESQIVRNEDQLRKL